MKRIIGFAIILIAAMSCSKSEIALPETETINVTEATREFSQILSKALSSEPEMRDFIKTEALKQFDKDYDVFYPWVKDIEIANTGKTFKEVLLTYDTNSKLESIEESLPLLNIFVPDWGWIEAFSINNWDIANNNISVGYLSNQYDLNVYTNGHFDGIIPAGNIPDFPIVLVKNNERMKISPTTRSGETVYEFIDPEFDGTASIETKAQYYDREIETEPCVNFVASNEIDNLVVGAYNEFRYNDAAAHRDYIYYGMTNNITAGKRNVHIYEYITKFAFGTPDSEYIYEDGDFVGLPSEYIRYVEITDQTLINHFIYDGNLELYFHVCLSPTEGTINETPIHKSVKFTDLFQLSKVHVKYRKDTWFSDPKWTFTVDTNCFIPKWCDANIKLPRWDISTHSSTMTIYVEERDNGNTTKETFTAKNVVATNFAREESTNISGTIGNVTAGGSVKTSYGVTNTTENTHSIEVTSTDASDHLGKVELDYDSPIISSAGTLDGQSGYYVNLAGEGNFVTMMILPRYI